MAYVWTDERVERLVKLRADAVRAAKIAAELGVTRNAVIGKAKRVKAPCGAAPACILIPPRTRGGKRFATVGSPKLPEQRLAKVLAESPPAPAAHQPVPFTAVGRNQCRFSIDLPAPPSADMLVCGARTVPGLSWCRTCAIRVFTRPAEAIAKLRSAA